ncbi:uncharacterized protein [Sagmatias obliquidens]|uniref:uncharacterized protein n=1 Tax=Sagmatias obliquidens TaxID=3371155 RepID=UPI000F444C67|nr:uncharacterized protein LOC113610638 [Lagenorhynchus obliquidens]
MLGFQRISRPAHASGSGSLFPPPPSRGGGGGGAVAAAGGAVAAAAGAGDGRGAEPGRSRGGGGPGGGRCGPDGGAGHLLSSALGGGRGSGAGTASLEVLRVQLRPAHNLGRGPGRADSTYGAPRRKTRGPWRGPERRGGGLRAAGAEGQAGRPPLLGLSPRPSRPGGRAAPQRSSLTRRWKGRFWKSKTSKRHGAAPVTWNWRGGKMLA